MDIHLLHRTFDVVMLLALIVWTGRRAWALLHSETVEIFWECVMAEWHRAHRPQPEETSAAMSGAVDAL